LGGGYRIRPSGDLELLGERPGPEWHIHGWMERWLYVLVDGELQRRRLFKRRWLQPDEKRTQHSRPSDEFGAIQFCGVVVAVMLWAWLDGYTGLHRSTPAVADLCDGRPSTRTVQRWLRAALPHADEFQQRIRRALIERCEPRPIEELFPRGLSPPEGLTRRRWQAPQRVTSLWRALAILFVGAIRLELSTTVLLAEARGR
jgi:hypothetical protein